MSKFTGRLRVVFLASTFTSVCVGLIYLLSPMVVDYFHPKQWTTIEGGRVMHHVRVPVYAPKKKADMFDAPEALSDGTHPRIPVYSTRYQPIAKPGLYWYTSDPPAKEEKPQ